MAQITLKTPTGTDAGSIELDDAVFGIQPNVPVLHQVVTAQLANRRAGTQSTKTRSEVRGGGAKPYRQKGTGNARQGSTNAPHYTGGGIALGPKPRSYAQRTPKKMIKLATRSALSDRAGDGKVVVVESWGLESPRTKDAKAALAALGLDGRVLVVIDSYSSPVALSFRNLPEVQLIKAGELNAYDILCNDWIVFEQSQLPVGEGTSKQATGQATDDTRAPETDGSLEHGEPKASSEDRVASEAANTISEDEQASSKASAASSEDEQRSEATSEHESSQAASAPDTQSVETGGSFEGDTPDSEDNS